MLLPIQEHPSAYMAIKCQDNKSFSQPYPPTGPVLIFVAVPDVDALAAVRIITRLLQKDLITYQVHPVQGYGMLQQSWERIVGYVKPRSVVCVNCGACVDLGALLGLDHDDQNNNQQRWLRVYVLDSRRPFHLANIESDRIFLFFEGDEFEESALPNIGYENELGFVKDDSSDDDDDDDDDDGDEVKEVDSGRDNGSDDDDGDDHDESGEDDALGYDEDDVVFGGDDAEGDQRKKRRKRSKRRRKRRIRLSAQERERRDESRAYYKYAYSTMSSACLGHILSRNLNKSSLDTLWLAIIGVTDQFLSLRISSSDYQDAMAYFHEQIPDLAPSTEGDQGESGVLDVGYSASQGSSGGSKRIIAPSTELRLDMVRHWNLHDSLLYSTYTITRLAAWRQTGRRRLLEFLATLGIPLHESRQKWCYMKSECKSALDNRLSTTLARFNLGNGIRYDSYVRSMPGHWGDISAADVVFSTCALLEFDQGSSEASHLSFDKAVEKRFWTAYDAMAFRKADLLSSGLSLAIGSQKLIAEVGGEVIERRKFVPSGPFRYAFLRDLQSKHTFAQSLLLTKLALFLIEALIQQGANHKPFVVLAPHSTRNVWIAVGAMGRGAGKNDFGSRFRRAAAKTKCHLAYDGFDAAVVEIEDGEESEFIHVLHDIML